MYSYVSRFLFSLVIARFFAYFFAIDPPLILFTLAITAPVAVLIFYPNLSNLELPDGRIMRLNKWRSAFAMSVIALAMLASAA